MTRNLALILAMLLTGAQAAANCPDPAPQAEAPLNAAGQPPDRSQQVMAHEPYLIWRADPQGRMQLIEGRRWIWRDRPGPACEDRGNPQTVPQVRPRS